LDLKIRIQEKINFVSYDSMCSTHQNMQYFSYIRVGEIKVLIQVSGKCIAITVSTAQQGRILLSSNHYV